jgi:hypothetical protein
MASTGHDERVAAQTKTTKHAEEPSDAGAARIHVWVNWILALLTIPAAVVVVIFGLGVVMSYAACSGQRCPQQGTGGLWLDILWFGSPVVAGLTIVISLFTSRRRRGIIVPLCAWALLVADVGLLALYAQS